MQEPGKRGTLPRVEAKPAIYARGVTKRFGDTVAVDALELTIPAGMFYGLLGPNGAGKTTSVGMLTGTLRPTKGNIELLGNPLDPDQPWFKARMGVVAEEPALFSRLKGFEQLVFTGRMFGLGAGESAKRARELLLLLKLDGDGDTLIADYSRGMRKKLAIGCALIHAPTLLFFDEPFEGVDALSAETIRQVLSGLCGRGATVLLTTHILEVAEKICQRVGIIHRGKLAFEADMSLLQQKGQRLFEVFSRVVGLEEPRESFPEWLIRK
jgi:ABC-2 type transport system ATP-binding protein